jgi:hypothetical protein
VWQAQPFSQSSQHEQSQLQSGQSLQHSSEQHEPSAFTGVVVLAEFAATPAAIRPAATARPPNNFVNMENSLSDWMEIKRQALGRDV